MPTIRQSVAVAICALVVAVCSGTECLLTRRVARHAVTTLPAV